MNGRTTDEGTTNEGGAKKPMTPERWSLRLKIGAVLVFLAIASWAVWSAVGISYRNHEARTRNLHATQQEVVKIFFDKTWKVVRQKAQIKQEYAADFERIYEKIMSTRSQGGELMKWIQEHNPEYDSSVSKDIMVAVEALRSELANEQKKLKSIEQQHRNCYDTAPSNWWVKEGDTPETKKVVSIIITSAKADDAMSTGHEDNVDVFDKK
jgi:hypothetical protein